MESQALITPEIIKKHEILLFSCMQPTTPYDIIRSILHILNEHPNGKSYYLDYEFNKLDDEFIKIKNKYSFSTGVFDRELINYMYMRAGNNQWYAEMKFNKGNDELFNMFGEIEKHFGNIKQEIFGDKHADYDHDNHAQENRNYFFKITDDNDENNKQRVILTRNGEIVNWGKIFSFRDEVMKAKKLEILFNVDQIKIDAENKDKKPLYFIEYVISQINIIE